MSPTVWRLLSASFYITFALALIEKLDLYALAIGCYASAVACSAKADALEDK